MPWSKAERIAYGGWGTELQPFTKAAPLPMLVKGKTTRKPTSQFVGLPVPMIPYERLKELPEYWYIQVKRGRKKGDTIKVKNPWYEAAERLRNKRK